jgi:SpoVK/Ycf46/Vps4 family AAA+-type ATPase
MMELTSETESKTFKFRELKIYGSTEWLADNKKKYRQVFDRYETGYVYAELSFYNKSFDRDDWDVEVELKCFSTRKGKAEICSLPFTRKISKFDHVVYVREGWGNKKEGVFWKRGTYYWEAWIDGEKVATKYFYIEDTGHEPLEGESPYCELQSVKLYEGPFDDVLPENRLYLKTFNAEETRYVYTEVFLRNNYFTKAWQCELFIKFYNDARELKGQIVRLQKVERGDDMIRLTAGWGSNVKGSWRKDRYTAEIVFMDKLLAIIPFYVDDFVEDGIAPVFLPNREIPLILGDEQPELHLSFDELMVRMDGLVGLAAVKQKIRDYAQYVQFLRLRKEKGFEETEEIQLHTVYIGNPGTGKTTIAKMMGQLYKSLGLLSRGHLIEVDRSDLVGEYIGQTAPKTKEIIDRARGGVMFIDEAYALSRSQEDSKDFGREVIEILVKEMSNGKGDLAVIVAGYPKEMKQFLDSNPGLRSRFKMTFEFTDYLPQELMTIVDLVCAEKGVRLNAESWDKVRQLLTDAYRNRDRAFGNARFVQNIIEQAKINLGLRAMAHKDPKKLSKEDLLLILPQDIDRIQLKKKKELPAIPIDEALLIESLRELNALIGMQNIKNEIRELIQIIRFHLESGTNVLKKFHFHTVLLGNPGTGKTSVARILAKVLKALGVLERGHIVETDRQGLVAGYVGQTAIKTAEKIDEALGGVLFVDEAYALTNRAIANGDFGDEAIQTLLKRMEDHRGEFFVFAAGYTDNMEAFLKANPGLSSRFDRTFKFEDYSPDELLQIAVQMLQEESLTLDEASFHHIQRYLKFIYDFRDKYFGNARTVRQIVLDIIKKHNYRMSSIPSQEREMSLITTADVEHLTLDKSNFVFNRRGIGFGS